MCRSSDILTPSPAPLPKMRGLSLDLRVPFFLRKFARWPHPSPFLSHWAVGRIDSGNSVERTWGAGEVTEWKYCITVLGSRTHLGWGWG